MFADIAAEIRRHDSHDNERKQMKAKSLLAVLAATCILSACSSAGSSLADGLTKPFDPNAKDWKQLTVSESVPDGGILELPTGAVKPKP